MLRLSLRRAFVSGLMFDNRMHISDSKQHTNDCRIASQGV